MPPRASARLTNEVLNRLYEHGVFAWRSSSTGIPSPQGLRTAPKKGVSDILAVMPPNGRLLAIEVKIGTDRLSPEQRGFIKNVEHVGGKTCVISSLLDFEQCWKEVERGR